MHVLRAGQAHHHRPCRPCLCSRRAAVHPLPLPLQALAAHPSLASLALAGCKVRSEGASHLAPALAASTSLRHLDLGRNQLGDRGAAALAEALARNRSLASLDLRHNGVGLVGCRLLGAALRERNGVLRTLLVAGNEMEDEYLQVGRCVCLWGGGPASKRVQPSQNNTYGV